MDKINNSFLGLTAAKLATMSLKLATNSPGGVVHASLSDKGRCSNATGVYMCVGEAVLAVIHQGTYVAFLISNTISFIASLSVFLGCVINLTRIFNIQIPERLLLVGTFIAFTSLALTYLFVVVSLAVIGVYHIMISNLTFKQENTIADEPVVDLLKYLTNKLDDAVARARLPSGRNPL